MRIPKLASAFIFVGCVVAYLTYVKWHFDGIKSALHKAPNYVPIRDYGDSNEPAPEEADSRHFQYGIMFDAGSTGTRIHVFKFLLKEHEAPKLAHETFRAIKPGLSAYADDPDKCREGIQELLKVAKESIPVLLWEKTPLVLKATAGLRLLPGEKATHLLDKVRNVFEESPFLSRPDGVSIMDGTDEGVSAWITVNFLIGSLHGSGQPTVGMLDLGGGSTQITFSTQDEDEISKGDCATVHVNHIYEYYQPQLRDRLKVLKKKTIQTSPFDDITSFQMFNSTHTLYAHSYLGLGLMSARLAILGGIEGEPYGNQELVSPCLSPQFTGQWEHAEVQYIVKGQKAGEPMYESCYKKVEKVLYNKIKKAEEVKNMDFYAFSYYYDRAVDISAIDEKTGGTIEVNNYIDSAKRVCSNMEITPGEHPFLCLDLTYLSLLLQELGFPKEKVLKLARKINGAETSWALGATFHYLESLRRQ